MVVNLVYVKGDSCPCTGMGDGVGGGPPGPQCCPGYVPPSCGCPCPGPGDGKSGGCSTACCKN
jgi:hypothetical protein